MTNSSGSGTGLGNVLVNAQATLAGSGFIAPGVSKNVTIADFATIAPGTVGASSGQALTIQLNGGDFSLQGILDLNLFTNSSGITSTEADRLVLGGTGTVTLGTFATLKVTSSLNQASLVAGSAWKILDWGTITRTGKFSGLDEVTNPYLNDINLPSLDAGLYWDITNLYTTGNLVVAVPEPSRLLLWILALLSMASRRRRPLL